MSDNQPAPIPAPIIVTALFDKADHAWFDALRRAHFPPERNVLAAHLTMFHHLPPSTAAEVKQRLADAFVGLLTPQDQAGWRPHVTIQNKVEPPVARALLAQLRAEFRPRPLQIAGLAAWWYRGGPWELLSRHMFSA